MLTTILHYLISIVIFCPIILFILLLVGLKKTKKFSKKALGYSADIVTLVLFISVPLIIHSIWKIDITSYFFVFFLIVAITLSFWEWRHKKELIVMLLLRKLWRIYFLFLIILYTVILLIGLVQNIINYSMS